MSHITQILKAAKVLCEHLSEYDDEDFLSLDEDPHPPSSISVYRDALAVLLANEEVSAALAQPEPVASLYIGANGEREVDDWKCELPAGRHVLYTVAKVAQPEPVSQYGGPELQSMILAKLAQPEPVSLTDEQDRALCEAYCNTHSDEYFKARPQLDSDVNRRIFYAGHRKAWITVAAAKGGA